MIYKQFVEAYATSEFRIFRPLKTCFGEINKTCSPTNTEKVRVNTIIGLRTMISNTRNTNLKEDLEHS